MNPRLLLAGIIAVTALVLAGLAYGGDAPRANGTSIDDVQDFVFFTDGRPLLVRAHVRVDGQSYRAIWNDYVNRVFKFLDTDGDGVLSAKEIERIPPIQFLTGNGIFNARMIGGRVDRPAANKDGKITRDELAVFLRKSGAAPFQFQMGRSFNNVYGAKVITLGDRQPVSSEALNDAIFSLLDTNKDGKLSREELAAAPAVFATRDVNDDEMITPQELLPSARVFNPRAAAEKAVARARAGLPDEANANAPVMLIQPGESGAAVARQLLARYARNGKKKLTATELGMDKASFDRLDMDKEGELDSQELAHFPQRPPDVELTVRIGTKGDGESAVDGALRPDVGLQAKLTKADNAVQVDLGVTHIEVHAGEEQTRLTNLNFRLRDQYINFFKMADTDNNGYLDEKEAKASPFFRDIFKALDADGDGMLYEKEMVAYLDKVEEIQKSVQTGCVTLAFSDSGNGLFDMLDRNRDGRLSVRELRGAVDLLKDLDRNGDGSLERTEIPHKYELRVRRGPANSTNDFNNVVVVAKSYGTPNPQPVKKGAGPLWFRKMDINHDGDLSRREFLGSDEDFKRIDLDGDGLISAQEAEAYDKLMRQSAPAKR